LPDIYRSRGSVATRLRCSGIFNACFVTYLMLSLTVKKLCKKLSYRWQTARHV